MGVTGRAHQPRLGDRTIGKASQHQGRARVAASVARTNVPAMGSYKITKPQDDVGAESPESRVSSDVDLTREHGDLLRVLSKIQEPTAERAKGLLIADANAVNAKVIAMVHESPVSAPDKWMHLNRLHDLRAELQDFQYRLNDSGITNDTVLQHREGMCAFVNHLQDVVCVRMAEVSGSLSSNPLSAKAIFHSKSFTTAAAIKLIERQLAGPQLTQPAREKLLLAKTFLEERRAKLLTTNQSAPLSSAEISKLMGSKGTDKGIGSGPPQEIQDKLDAAGDFDREMPDLPRFHAAIREEGMMQVFLERLFEKSDLPPLGDMAEALADARKEALNEQPWNTIEKEVALVGKSKDGEEAQTMKSSVVPQSQLGNTFDDLNGGGVISHMTQGYKHATALAVSSLRAGAKNLFKGIRHGTLSAYDISASELKTMCKDAEKRQRVLEPMVKDLLPHSMWVRDNAEVGAGYDDPTATIAKMRTDPSFRAKCARAMRAEAGLRRAKDVVTAALVNNPGKFEKALANETVDISITSVGLLTPDSMRAALARGNSKGMNEKSMLKDQLAAWKTLANQGITELTVKDKDGHEIKVKVNVKVNAFNFGVNGLAFKSLNFFSGWRTADQQNKAAMADLIGATDVRSNGAMGGDVGRWLSEAPRETEEDRAKIAQVTELAQQVAAMWDSKSYRNEGEEPYKMVSRLALLSSMIGQDVCWNCKSGKDRTGECDVATKTLAAEIHMTGIVPIPESPRDQRQKTNHFNMAVSGGNLEFQNYNTAAAGFKLGGVPSLMRELSSLGDAAERFRHFRGIAGYYGA